MKLKELLNTIDLDKTAQYIDVKKTAEYIAEHNAVPDSDFEQVKTKLKKVVSNICNAKPIENDLLNEIVVMEVWDLFDDDNSLIYDCVVKKPNDGERYDLLFTPWGKLINLNVAEKSIDKYDINVIGAEIIMEMTFWGFTEEENLQEINKQKKSLNKADKQLNHQASEEEQENFVYDGTESNTNPEEKQLIAEKMKKNNAIYEEFGFRSPYGK